MRSDEIRSLLIEFGYFILVNLDFLCEKAYLKYVIIAPLDVLLHLIMKVVRRCKHAGTWYPADPEELSLQIQASLDSAVSEPPS